MTRALAATLALCLTLPAQAEMCTHFPTGGVWVSVDAATAVTLTQGHFCTELEFRTIRDGLSELRARLFVAKVDLNLAKKKVDLYTTACDERVSIGSRTCSARLAILEDELRLAQGGATDWWSGWWAQNGLWAAIAGTALGVIAGAVITWRVTQ